MLALCGCSAAGGKLLISQGNIFYSQGDYVKAIGSFTGALSQKTVTPYAEYALGTAYLAVDEGEAALRHFLAAEQSAGERRENRELLYRARYNSGIVRFQQHDYQGAADDFKRALQVQPARTEAKHNLELCLLSIHRQSSQTAVNTSRTGGIRENKNESRSGVLLDFMRRREVENWKSFEWGGDEDSSTPDY
ncbi:MAG: tetratricopeptide repeat protein [Spirochaetaceae bacterium]|nr:tetratricopeptide repeat protein [Spirochaetaceae bacterium]